MDNRITKERIINKLSYDWLKYIGVLLAIIIFWVGVFQWRFRIKRNEEIILFTSANNIVAEEGKEMESYLLPYGIRRVTYTFYPREEQNYKSILQLKGLGEADLLILSGADLAELDCARYFIALDDALISNYVQEERWEYYQTGEVSYGIMIYQHSSSDYNDGLNFCKWIHFGQEQDYFLLINGLSPNVGEYAFSAKGKGKSSTALYAFKFLLNEYSE